MKRSKYTLALWHVWQKQIEDNAFNIDDAFDLLVGNQNVPLEDGLWLVTKINLEMIKKSQQSEKK